MASARGVGLRAGAGGVGVGFVLVAAIALFWLCAIVPGILHNVPSASCEGICLIVNPVHVLDLAFTFPFTAVGAAGCPMKVTR